jgi:hypothetical protein
VSSAVLLIALVVAAIFPAPAIASEPERRPVGAVARLPVHSIVDVNSLDVSGHAEAAPPEPRVKRRLGRAAAERERQRTIDVAPTEASPRAAAATEAIVPLALEGLANSDNVALAGAAVLPSDANLGVGPAHVFQMVNVTGRISTKTGATVTSFALADFFAVDPGFGESDPRIIYDALSGRWLATYVEFRDLGTTGESSIILMVSQSADPTGSFCRYRLGNPTTETFQQDFPMLGVGSDKVVVSYNGFGFGPGEPFLGAGYYVLNKADLVACANPRIVSSPPSSSRFTAHPAQALGPSGTLFMAMRDAFTTLTILAIDGVPGESPVTETVASRSVRPWIVPPAAPQPGTGVLLDTGDARIVSATWQADSLWLAAGERCTPAGDTAVRSCLRIFEVRTDTMTVRQDLTFGDPGRYYSFPALRPDGGGNRHVVFTSSSTTEFASVRTTHRLIGDPVNTMRPATLVRAGGGAQTSSSGRMGDYSGAALDPTDPRVVWLDAEYVAAPGNANWGTYVVAQLAEPAPPPYVALAANASVFSPGQPFSLDLTIANLGPTVAVDVYVGLLPPASAGPVLGCPGGDAVVLFADALATPMTVSLAAAPPTFPASFTNVTLAFGVPLLPVPDLLSFTWPSLPAGAYTFFVALARAGSNPPEILAIATVTVNLTP